MKLLILNRYNSGTRRDIKKRLTAIFLIFAALSNSVIIKKKTFHLHFKRSIFHSAVIYGPELCKRDGMVKTMMAINI